MDLLARLDGHIDAVRKVRMNNTKRLEVVKTKIAEKTTELRDSNLIQQVNYYNQEFRKLGL